jgi:hypothetical protein
MLFAVWFGAAVAYMLYRLLWYRLLWNPDFGGCDNEEMPKKCVCRQKRPVMLPDSVLGLNG